MHRPSYRSRRRLSPARQNCADAARTSRRSDRAADAGAVRQFLVSTLLVLAVQPFAASIKPLAGSDRANVDASSWYAGCPVPLSGLRVLAVRHWGFDGRVHTGELVVNSSAAAQLQTVFKKL